MQANRAADVVEMITIRDDIVIAFEDHCFGPPWEEPEAIVLLHAVPESSKAWIQWVPVLSTHLRVVRPDMPGFGRSPMPRRYEWTPAQVADDVAHLLDALGIDRFHLVGAKFGGIVALHLASDVGDRVSSLSVMSSPAIGTNLPRRGNLRDHAAATQRARLGHRVSDAQLDWWTDLMASTDERAADGANLAFRDCDLRDRLPHISAPTLVVTTADGALQSVASVEEYANMIPDARVQVLADRKSVV